MANVNGNYVVTDKVRFNYVHLLKPYAQKQGNGEPMYSACLIIPKSDTETINAINKGIENAIRDKIELFGGKMPTKNQCRSPLRDGDTDREGREEYANCYFINVKSKYQPRVVDRNKKDIESEEQVYSGMYGRASISFFAYSNNGNKGVSCGLGAVQKLEDGPRIGGGHTIDDLFGDLGGDDNSLPF